MEHLGVKTFVHPDYLEFEVSGEIDRERIVQIIQGTSKLGSPKITIESFLSIWIKLSVSIWRCLNSRKLR